MKKFSSSYGFIFTIVMAALWIVGCTENSNKILPTPQTGKSSLGGLLVDKTGLPLKHITIRLAEVYRENENSDNGAYILDTAFSPGTITDESGFFFFENIEPIEYVIVVGDIENNNYEIISQENGRPRVWHAVEGQILDVGKLQIDYLK